MDEASREAILDAIRLARRDRLQRDASSGPATDAAGSVVEARLGAHPTGPRPALQPSATPQGDPRAACLAEFGERAEAAAARCIRVPDERGAVAAITEYLGEHGVQGPPLAAEHPALRALPWPAGEAPRFAQARGDTPAGLTLATLGIAETGSVALCSTPHSPTGMNFLPDILICLLPTDAVVAHLEDAWARLREQGPLPRAVNLVTGPSRTADVEQTLQLGAHGPRHLLVVLVDHGLHLAN